MKKTGIIILSHGSRGEKALKDMPVIMNDVVAGVSSLLPGDIAVDWAALQFNNPTLPETTALLVKQGINHIVIVPYFLFSGRHIDEDIPEIIREMELKYPGVSFTLARSMGEGERFTGQVTDRIREIMPELWLETPLSPVAPTSIEESSMAIIEKLLPAGLSLSASEITVAKRVIHACGDAQVAGLLSFSPEAVSAGLQALRKGCPIITDVRMVAAAVNRLASGACGCSVVCALDEVDTTALTAAGTTRAAAAMKYQGKRLNGAIIAIGNAPTALLALLDMMKNERILPALVIGMPVGFVRAAESKELLFKSSIPFITIRGTRGGSNMAAAAVNALLKMLTEK